MSKHEPTFSTEPTIDPDLLRRTEAAILAYMAEHDGQMPTQQKVNETVRTSFSRLGPAFRSVKERLLATQTRLANMPEIPDELRIAHEQMLKDLWTRTRDLQNGEIVDLRRAQAAKDDSHRKDMTETQAIIALVEMERDGEAARAEAAETENATLREKLEGAVTELAAATARLSEREHILAILMSAGGLRDDVAEKAADPKTTEKQTAKRSRKPDGPETYDLPMAHGTPSADPEAGK